MALLKFNVVKLVVAISAVVASAAAVAQTYSYDKVGRLTKVVYANGAEVSYVYDKAGNRVTETVKVGTGPAKPTVAGSPAGASGAPTPAAGPGSPAPARVDGRASREVIR